jgi:hypothetical protein
MGGLRMYQGPGTGIWGSGRPSPDHLYIHRAGAGGGRVR